MAGVTPLKINGHRVCLDCQQPIPRVWRSPRVRCEVCDPLHYMWLRFLSGQTLCAARLQRAIIVGTLPPAREFHCADCGTAAQCYDHRDYSEPLNVVPVCTSCNIRRGPAKPVSRAIVSALLLAQLQPAQPEPNGA